jgi:serine/threonine protein phosphatase PrpC
MLATYTIKGQKGSSMPNQDCAKVDTLDSVAWSQGRQVWVVGVFDGHGDDGHLISNAVANCLFAEIRQAAFDPLYAARHDFREHGLRRACARTDEWLSSHHASRARHSGTTAVVVVICVEEIMVLNVGDSGLAFTTQDGTTHYVTRDHSPDDPTEMGRIVGTGAGFVSASGGSTPRVYLRTSRGKVRGGLAIARAFGDHYLRSAGVIAEPDVTCYPLGMRSGDDGWHSFPVLITLASDGLWDVINETELTLLLEREGPPARKGSCAAMRAARLVAHTAYQAWLADSRDMYVDDITIAMIALDWRAALAEIASTHEGKGKGEGAVVVLGGARANKRARPSAQVRDGDQTLSVFLDKCRRNSGDCREFFSMVLAHSTALPASRH